MVNKNYYKIKKMGVEVVMPVKASGELGSFIIRFLIGGAQSRTVVRLSRIDKERLKDLGLQAHLFRVKFRIIG